MSRFALLIGLLTGELAGVQPFASAQDKKEEAGKEVALDLETTRLSTPVEIGDGKYYRIRVVGTLKNRKGEGELLLDPNEQLSLNEFGDIIGGSRFAEDSVKVRMGRLRLLDPMGLGRMLYSVSAEKLPTLKLVVPVSPKESYRLLVCDEKDIKHVLTLEGRIKKNEKKGAGKPVAKYRAEQKDKKVTVFATGENPTTGWKNQLEVLPIDIYPPEFRFTQTKPDGIPEQVVTPFAVEKSAPAPKKIDHVFVTDATGKHKVAVTHAK